jgi:hypothetical protein
MLRLLELSSGTESIAEVKEPIAKRFKTGSVQSCDSAPAFKSVNHNDARLKNVPIITVVHGCPKSSNRQFVKTCQLPISKMSPELEKMLRGQAPGAKKGKTLPVAAGDNCVEGLFGNIAQTQRRMNLRGRGTVHGHAAQISTLSSAWLLRGCGTEHVLKAMSMYRVYAQGSMEPKKAFSDRFWEKKPSS